MREREREGEGERDARMLTSGTLKFANLYCLRLDLIMAQVWTG